MFGSKILGSKACHLLAIPQNYQKQVNTSILKESVQTIEKCRERDSFFPFGYAYFIKVLLLVYE